MTTGTDGWYLNNEPNMDNGGFAAYYANKLLIGSPVVLNQFIELCGNL